MTVDVSFDTRFFLFCAIHFRNSAPSGLVKLCLVELTPLNRTRDGLGQNVLAG